MLSVGKMYVSGRSNQLSDPPSRWDRRNLSLILGEVLEDTAEYKLGKRFYDQNKFTYYPNGKHVLAGSRFFREENNLVREATEEELLLYNSRDMFIHPSRIVPDSIFISSEDKYFRMALGCVYLDRFGFVIDKIKRVVDSPRSRLYGPWDGMYHDDGKIRLNSISMRDVIYQITDIDLLVSGKYWKMRENPRRFRRQY